MQVSGATTVGLLAALTFFGSVGRAQDVPELVDLVFEPVPLSSAGNVPTDLEPASANDERELKGSVDRHLAALESLRESDFVAELVEQLDLLASAYQGLDRHEDAIAALDEAISAVIEAGGRDSLEHARLQERKIPSYLALGDIGSADDTAEQIYLLYERNFRPGRQQMYYATIKLADWHTTAYYRENYAAYSPFLKRQRVVVPRTQRCISTPGFGPADASGGCDENAIFNGDIRDVFEQDINDARLRKIDRLYADYQDAMIEAGSARLDVVVDLAKRVARLAYATKQEMDFERDNYAYDPSYDGSREQAARSSPTRLDESYDSGVAALKYAITALRSVDGVRPEAIVAGLMNLGDWHLAYGKANAAREVYREAHDTLLDAGFSTEDIDLALATDLPIQIPVFATHLYTRRGTGRDESAELDFRGYVDVSYVVDTLGNASDFRTLGGSPDDFSRIERLLGRQLRSIKFRPLLRGGEPIAPGRIDVRYYYAH